MNPYRKAVAALSKLSDLLQCSPEEHKTLANLLLKKFKPEAYPARALFDKFDLTPDSVGLNQALVLAGYLTPAKTKGVSRFVLTSKGLHYGRAQNNVPLWYEDTFLELLEVSDYKDHASRKGRMKTQRPYRAIKEQLKVHGYEMTNHKANRCLRDLGLLKSTRKKGVPRSKVTSRGEKYGLNHLRSPSWYDDSFPELYKMIKEYAESVSVESE